MTDIPHKAALCYLATPYSKFPGSGGRAGIECAFEEAAKLAAVLICSGLNIYSPIVHCHPLSIYSHLDPYDHTIWLPANQAMMEACDTLIVAKMESWESSVGIDHEVKWYRAQGRRIYWLDPIGMSMTRERSSLTDGRCNGCSAVVTPIYNQTSELVR